jgi:hypothetical protein
MKLRSRETAEFSRAPCSAHRILSNGCTVSTNLTKARLPAETRTQTVFRFILVILSVGDLRERYDMTVLMFRTSLALAGTVPHDTKSTSVVVCFLFA